MNENNRIVPLSDRVSFEIEIEETLRGRMIKQRIIEDGIAGEWSYPWKKKVITRPAPTKEILDKIENEIVPKWIAMPKVKKLLKL